MRNGFSNLNRQAALEIEWVNKIWGNTISQLVYHLINSLLKGSKGRFNFYLTFVKTYTWMNEEEWSNIEKVPVYTEKELANEFEAFNTVLNGTCKITFFA